MAEVRIELLSRTQFVRTFYRAALDYSKTPWVQVANHLGCAFVENVRFPIVIVDRSNVLEIFIHDRKWKRLTKSKKFDPDLFVRQAENCIKNSDHGDRY